MSWQVKVVYVRNLPDSVTEEQLQKLFERHGEVTKVVLPAAKPGQAKRDFGFVHFADRASALKAIEKTEKYELEGLSLNLALDPSCYVTCGGLNLSWFMLGRCLQADGWKHLLPNHLRRKDRWA